MEITTSRAAVAPVLRSLAYRGRLRITAGPFAERQADALATYLALPADDVLHGFRLGAGQDAPGHPLDGWARKDSGATFGQWVSGLARLAATTGSEAAGVRARELVDGWAATLVDGDSLDPRMPNVYPYEKVVCGLVDAAVYAGHERALGLLERTVTWGESFFGAERPVPAANDFVGGWVPTGEWYTMAENLYRGWLAGAGDAVADFAATWLYPSYWLPFAVAHRTGAPPQVPVYLHAYSHVNTFASAAAAYEVTGDPELLEVLRGAHDWFTGTQTFATGGFGPFELTVPPGVLGASLEWRTDSAEIVCGSWAAFKLTTALLRFTGEPRYADWAERLVYSGLGAVTPVRVDGTSPYYHDYRLGTATRLPHWDHWPCCSGTYVQGVAHLSDLVAMDHAEGPAVLLYVPARLEWEDATLEIETGFPEQDTARVRVDVAAPREMALRLRVPEWSHGFAVTVDGVMHPLERDDLGWVVLRRAWSGGEVVEVTLGAALRILPVDAEHPNRVALAHGPVVLAQSAEWSAPLSLATPWAMVDLGAAFTREPGTLRYTPVGVGTHRLPPGQLRPLSEIPDRFPHRVYHDLDRPRII